MEKTKMVYYHGTSTACGVKRILLPPNKTQKLREDFRRKNLQVVFLTARLPSAMKYAKKACEKFGGMPVIYRAIPMGAVSINGVECSCDMAIIEEALKIAS